MKYQFDTYKMVDFEKCEKNSTWKWRRRKFLLELYTPNTIISEWMRGRERGRKKKKQIERKYNKGRLYFIYFKKVQFVYIYLCVCVCSSIISHLVENFLYTVNQFFAINNFFFLSILIHVINSSSYMLLYCSFKISKYISIQIIFPTQRVSWLFFYDKNIIKNIWLCFQKFIERSIFEVNLFFKCSSEIEFQSTSNPPQFRRLTYFFLERISIIFIPFSFLIIICVFPSLQFFDNICYSLVFFQNLYLLKRIEHAHF